MAEAVIYWLQTTHKLFVRQRWLYCPTALCPQGGTLPLQDLTYSDAWRHDARVLVAMSWTLSPLYAIFECLLWHRTVLTSDPLSHATSLAGSRNLASRPVVDRSARGGTKKSGPF